jgi:hypothetical protein
MDDVVVAMEALHAALTSDLEDLETRIRALGYSIVLGPEPDNEDVSDYVEARASLHSGLASIAEVLAWIQLKTEDDPEGEVAMALQPLPKVRGCVIH